MPKQNLQTILITGSSSGFGLESVVYLAQEGHRVIATVEDIDNAQSLTDKLQEKKLSATILSLDVTDTNSIKQVIEHIQTQNIQLDVLVNNAGVLLGGTLEDITDDEFRKQMDVNFFGMMNVMRACLPLMRNRGRGKIINLSSIAGYLGVPYSCAYVSSKWAIEGLSESLQYELKEHFNISLHVVEPGFYRTKIFKEHILYGSHVDNPESPYYGYSQSCKASFLEHVENSSNKSIQVAKCLSKIINAANPKFRNFPDNEARLAYYLKKFVPFQIVSPLIKKKFFK